MIGTGIRALVAVFVLSLLTVGLVPTSGAVEGPPSPPPPPSPSPGYYDLVTNSVNERRCEGSASICNNPQYAPTMSRWVSSRERYANPQMRDSRERKHRAWITAARGCTAPRRPVEEYTSYEVNVAQGISFDGPPPVVDGYRWRAGIQQVRHEFVCGSWGEAAWVTDIHTNSPTWEWRSADNGGPPGPPVDCGGGRLLGPVERDEFALNVHLAGGSPEQVESVRAQPCDWLNATPSNLVVSGLVVEDISEGIPPGGVVIGPPLVAGPPYAGVAPDPHAQAAAEFDCTGGIPRPPRVSAGSPLTGEALEKNPDRTWFQRQCKNVVSAATADGEQPRGAVYNGVLIAQVNAAISGGYTGWYVYYGGVHTAQYRPASGSTAYPASLRLDYQVRPSGIRVDVPLVGGLGTATPDPGAQAVTGTGAAQPERSLRTLSVRHRFDGGALSMGVTAQVRATATFGVADWTATVISNRNWLL